MAPRHVRHVCDVDVRAIHSGRLPKCGPGVLPRARGLPLHTRRHPLAHRLHALAVAPGLGFGPNERARRGAPSADPHRAARSCMPRAHTGDGRDLSRRDGLCRCRGLRRDERAAASRQQPSKASKRSDGGHYPHRRLRRIHPRKSQRARRRDRYAECIAVASERIARGSRSRTQRLDPLAPSCSRGGGGGDRGAHPR